MVKILCLILNVAVCIHFVSAQAKTAWSAANDAMGLGTTTPPDPTDHQINLAIVGVNNAQTELEAAQAAATVYSPTMDMSDNVKQALENKVRQLRTPPGWTHPIPPPLPFGFDVMHLVMNAYYGTATAAPVVGPPALPGPGPQQGPPTAIRRGPSPGKWRNHDRQQVAWPHSNSWDSGRSQSTGVGNAGGYIWESGSVGGMPTGNSQQGSMGQNNFGQQSGAPDWTPLASSNPDWINPFDFHGPTSNPSLWK